MESLRQLLDVTLAVFMIGNMLDMGLRLDARQALRDLRDLRFLLASLLWGFVVLPALAWGLAHLLPLEPAYATGLVLLGMAPCAPFLPPMVDKARGDLGYTAAFMLLSVLAIVAYMPLAVPRLTSGLSADAWTIARPLLLLLLLPLALGLALQRRSAALAARLHPWVKKLTGIDTAVMLVLCVVVYGEGFVSLLGSYVIGAQLVFFAAATLLPYRLRFGLPQEQRVVLSLGLATRNLGAAFAPLFAVPGADQRSVVVVALGVLMQAAFAFGAASVFARHTKAALDAAL
jgi:bile acid:Na+ symporter, BASS family